jgi:beta-xylosidase
MTSSSFSHAPGLPILHSKDLVNWSLINHALPRIEPADHFAKPQHGNGVWAPSFRFHEGTYYIFWGDPDFGIQVVTATDPAGKWSEPTLVIPGKGLIDPCPLFADDGRVWLVHAWAKSRSGIANRLTLRELTADAMSLKPGNEGETIIDADRITGYRTLEGPKFYQHDGQYWIFAPAGGVETGWQSVFRAKDIHGPYQERIVLSQGRTAINGPHQGGWVRTQNGEDWFVHFQDRGPMGRVVWLEPMTWLESGWPMIGADPDGNGRGEPVMRHRKPDLPPSPRASPSTTDLFLAKSLGLQWQWQANPDSAISSDGDGSLKLPATTLDPAAPNLWDSTGMLMQKPMADDFQVDTTVTLPGPDSGCRAGLIAFGEDYGWIGLEARGEGYAVLHGCCRNARENGEETVETLATTDSPVLHVRLRWRDAGQRCEWFYSLDGRDFSAGGETTSARTGRWVGARFGPFAVAGDSGPVATFSAVRVSPLYP